MATAVKTCVHHYIIERTFGLTARGICKYCGVKKIFDNERRVTASQSQKRLFHPGKAYNADAVAESFGRRL